MDAILNIGDLVIDFLYCISRVGTELIGKGHLLQMLPPTSKLSQLMIITALLPRFANLSC